jgi:hypothetical protein
MDQELKGGIWTGAPITCRRRSLFAQALLAWG